MCKRASGHDTRQYAYLNDVACRAESDKEYRHLSPQHACPQPPLARAKSELAGRLQLRSGAASWGVKTELLLWAGTGASGREISMHYGPPQARNFLGNFWKFLSVNHCILALKVDKKVMPHTLFVVLCHTLPTNLPCDSF